MEHLCKEMRKVFGLWLDPVLSGIFRLPHREDESFTCPGAFPGSLLLML